MLRIIAVLCGWMVIVFASAVLAVIYSAHITHYQQQFYFLPLLRDLKPGQTTRNDIEHLLGKAEYSFQSYMYFGGGYTVLRYTVQASGEQPVYLYLDEADKLRYVDVAGYTQSRKGVFNVGVSSSLVLCGTLLLVSGLRHKRERTAIVWWLTTALLLLMYDTFGTVISAPEHYRLGILLSVVIIPMGTISIGVLATAALEALLRRPQPGPPPVVHTE